MGLIITLVMQTVKYWTLLFPVFLTSCLSMFLDLTSLTPFFFSSVFKKMITMVTRSSTQICADAEDGEQQTS